MKISPHLLRNGNVLITAALAGAALLAQTVRAASGSRGITVGALRIEPLSDSLVRLEQRGPSGFEDRETFHAVNRQWPEAAFTTNAAAEELVIRTAGYVVHARRNAASLRDARVESPDGLELYRFDGVLENSRWLPGPADRPAAWWFADSPRLVPPRWGLTPAPSGAPLPESSGWDLHNDAPDVYVFVPGGDYRQLRRDFLKLTGPTPMVPLFALGGFDSRWYDYSEATALQQIDDYRAHRIPLDVLVVDTGWRQNASTGYRPNTNLFPDLRRFFKAAHAKNVRIMFNDHPEPVATNSLDAVELNYRYDGLSGLLDAGLDVWWYDRNWSVSLVTPKPSLKKEVWGMRMYHDMTRRARPGRRPLIMANVDGIDNGIRRRPPDVSTHRFAIQWTGDIGPGYDFLRRGVENAVESGVTALFPYMSEDLGGHTSNPTAEQYIRWIEYGALSPVFRPHCTHNLMRMPWTFGPVAEEVARRFVNMRYRLLPVLYTAARENYETGEPLLRRLDLDYPQFAEAGRNDQFLLGQSILVAPVLPDPLRPVPADWLRTPQGQTGLQGEYFANDDLSNNPVLTRIDRTVEFDWRGDRPAPALPADHFSIRWTGTLQVPDSAGDAILATLADDGARVWIDGGQVIDAWGPHDSVLTEAGASLSAGRPHQIRIEYLELTGNARLRLQYRPAEDSRSNRVVWIPPGTWLDAWTGRTIAGPAAVTNTVPLEQIPIFIRSGTILPLAPEMEFTGQRPWDPITLDLYPRAGETNRALLYEDDTLTTAYEDGQFRKTTAAVSADNRGHAVRVTIDAARGDFQGALPRRAWVLRVHRPPEWATNLMPVRVNLDGNQLSERFVRRARNEAAMPFGDSSGAPDTEVFDLALPAAPVNSARNLEIIFADSAGN